MVGEFEEIDSFQSFYPEMKHKKATTWNEARSSHGSAEFADDFSYGVRDENRFSPTRYTLLWQAVKYLEEKSLRIAGKGEIARLGFLIKTVGKKLRYSPKIEEAVDKILDRNIPGSPASQRMRDEKRRSGSGQGRHSSKAAKNRRHTSSNITKGINKGKAL